MTLIEAYLAEAVRDQALDRVSAPPAVEHWIDRVLHIIRVWPPGTLFTTDDIWSVLGSDRPLEPRALGAAMVAARSMGLVEHTGAYRKSGRVRCHARPVAIWRRR